MSAPLELWADALQFGDLASISKYISSRLGDLALLLAEKDLHRNWPLVFTEMSLRVHLNWTMKWKQWISASCCQAPAAGRSPGAPARIRQSLQETALPHRKGLGCCTCCRVHVGMKQHLKSGAQLHKTKSYSPCCAGRVRVPQVSPSAAKALTSHPWTPLEGK